MGWWLCLLREQAITKINQTQEESDRRKPYPISTLSSPVRALLCRIARRAMNQRFCTRVVQLLGFLLRLCLTKNVSQRATVNLHLHVVSDLDKKDLVFDAHNGAMDPA